MRGDHGCPRVTKTWKTEEASQRKLGSKTNLRMSSGLMEGEYCMK